MRRFDITIFIPSRTYGQQSYSGPTRPAAPWPMALTNVSLPSDLGLPSPRIFLQGWKGEHVRVALGVAACLWTSLAWLTGFGCGILARHRPTVETRIALASHRAGSPARERPPTGNFPVALL